MGTERRKDRSSLGTGLWCVRGAGQRRRWEDRGGTWGRSESGIGPGRAQRGGAGTWLQRRLSQRRGGQFGGRAVEGRREGLAQGGTRSSSSGEAWGAKEGPSVRVGARPGRGWGCSRAGSSHPGTLQPAGPLGSPGRTRSGSCPAYSRSARERTAGERGDIHPRLRAPKGLVTRRPGRAPPPVPPLPSSPMQWVP